MRFGTIICAAMTTLLGACGGGSGGGLGSTPPPPPPPQQNSTLTDLRFNDSFEAAAAESTYSVSKATGAATVSSEGVTRANVEVRYDAATQGYTLLLHSSNMADPSFGQSQRDPGGSNNVITVYERENPPKTESLFLFNPGAGNSRLVLTYTSYGAYQGLTDKGDSIEVDTAFFAFGIATLPGDMPRTGSATYTTLIDGQYADLSGVYAINGASSFSADFGTSKIAFQISPVGTHILNGGTLAFGTFSGGGDINFSNASFRSTGPVSSGAYILNLNGFFYGPQAAEIGGVFAFSPTGGGGRGQGALVGRKN